MFSYNSSKLGLVDSIWGCMGRKFFFVVVYFKTLVLKRWKIRWGKGLSEKKGKISPYFRNSRWFISWTLSPSQLFCLPAWDHFEFISLIWDDRRTLLMLVCHHFSALINRLVSEKTSLCGRAPEHAPFIPLSLGRDTTVGSPETATNFGRPMQ